MQETIPQRKSRQFLHSVYFFAFSSFVWFSSTQVFCICACPLSHSLFSCLWVLFVFFFVMPIMRCVSLSIIPSCRKHDVLHIPLQKRISNAILPHIEYHSFYCVLCSKYSTFIIIALVSECNIIFIALYSNYSMKLWWACCFRQLFLLLLTSCRKHLCHSYIYEQPWKLC